MSGWLDAAFTAFEQPFIRLYVGAAVQDPSITARESFFFWRTNGAPLHVCWSCLGNEQRETGFNWTAVGDKHSGGAHGIAQWHEARRQVILKGCGIDVNTAGHKGQLSAMLWELKQTGLWAKLLASKSVEEACDILVRLFERPAQIRRDEALQVGFANILRAKYGAWEENHAPQLVVTTPAAPVPVPATKPTFPAAPAIITRAQGNFPSHLTKAGSFAVVQDPCPHLSMTIDAKAPRAGVGHTTEGYWQSAIGVFKQHWAPHFLVGLNPQKKPQISQLVPIGYIGASLEALNNLAIVQVEVVAFSQKKIWLPDAGTLDALASLIDECATQYGIPLTHPWKDGDFGRYGDNPHRHSGNFGKVAGWYEHGDIPMNHHWDMGALKWSAVFARAHALAAVA